LSIKVGGSWREVGEFYVKKRKTWKLVAKTIPEPAAEYLILAGGGGALL
jgi:hypothetical protein